MKISLKYLKDNIKNKESNIEFPEIDSSVIKYDKVNQLKNKYMNYKGPCSKCSKMCYSSDILKCNGR